MTVFTGSLVLARWQSHSSFSACQVRYVRGDSVLVVPIRSVPLSETLRLGTDFCRKWVGVAWS